MPVAFSFMSASIGQAEYDGLMVAIGREQLDAPIPDGIIAHVAGPRPEGWQVVDIWESQEAAEAYYGCEAFAVVQSTAESAGITVTPWPVHRLEIYQTLRETS